MGIPIVHPTKLSERLLFNRVQSVHGPGRLVLSPGGGAMTEVLAMEIESLRKLKTKALRARFEELFGEESRSSNHAHLFRRIAWRLQANAEGDLSERARKRALDWPTMLPCDCVRREGFGTRTDRLNLSPCHVARAIRACRRSGPF